MNADERRCRGGEGVSFVVPAYNSSATIRDALESIASQSVQPREIVVVDDASTDDTCVVVEGMADEHTTVRLVRMEQNGGPATARNRGVQEASGEWVAFLDADDMCVPGRLEKQLAFLRENPDVAMVCGQAERISGSIPGRGRGPAARGDGRVRMLGLSDFIQNNQVATSTVLIRRDVFLQLGGFDPQFRGPEDLDLWLRLAAEHEIGMLDVPLALYRHVPGSLSMDPERFLPQVMGVLAKAFADGGALAAHPEWRAAAESTQHWHAAWMAFSRGHRGQAVRFWAQAYVRNARSSRPARRKWFRLLLRYIAGPKP